MAILGSILGTVLLVGTLITMFYLDYQDHKMDREKAARREWVVVEELV